MPRQAETELGGFCGGIGLQLGLDTGQALAVGPDLVGEPVKFVLKSAKPGVHRGEAAGQEMAV